MNFCKAAALFKRLVLCFWTKHWWRKTSEVCCSSWPEESHAWGSHRGFPLYSCLYNVCVTGSRGVANNTEVKSGSLIPSSFPKLKTWCFYCHFLQWNFLYFWSCVNLQSVSLDFNWKTWWWGGFISETAASALPLQTYRAGNQNELILSQVLATSGCQIFKYSAWVMILVGIKSKLCSQMKP